MLALIRTLLIPIFSLIFAALGSGLFTTFVSVRLEMDGNSLILIGAIVSVSYAGVFAGALVAPGWVRRFGYTRATILIYALNAAAIFCHIFWSNPYYWMALRFAVGLAIGAFFTVIESWFLKSSSKAMRGQALSIYLILYYAALSTGQLLLNVSNPRTSGSFLLAGALSMLAIVPLFFGASEPPPKPIALAQQKVFQFSPLGVLGGIASGMVMASIYGLVPVYGKEINLTIEEISQFMAVIIFGGFSLQWPLGKWADIQGRRVVLLIVCLVTALLGICIAILDGLSFFWLLPLCWLFGGTAFALYPLSMAYVCDGVEEEHLPAAAGRFISSYGIGAVAGPLIASYSISLIGMSGLFYFMALVCVLLGLVPALRKS